MQISIIFTTQILLKSSRSKHHVFKVFCCCFSAFSSVFCYSFFLNYFLNYLTVLQLWPYFLLSTRQNPSKNRSEHHYLVHNRHINSIRCTVFQRFDTKREIPGQTVLAIVRNRYRCKFLLCRIPSCSTGLHSITFTHKYTL